MTFQKKTTTVEHIDSLKKFFTDRGFVEYKPGMFSKTDLRGIQRIPDKMTRYIFRDKVLRFEVASRHSDGSLSWVRLRSGYYGDIKINENNKLSGMKVFN